jgi:hypothetical protein
MIVWLAATQKTPFLFKGHNSAKTYSSRKPAKYAQLLELQINPVKLY